ncbi:MAG TPA: tetratricopeptide repeat protein, partial [Mycobacteriales bacterium]|nr:tetratricopeptide repeat protein [Mycobacteriales bacterium]
ELELDRGRADQVLDRLRDLVARHPERPGLLAALIRALHATDRTAEARTVHNHAAVTAQRHGVPLHPKLAQVAAVLRAGHQPSPPTRPSTVPFQLPADTSHFTGRADELTRMLDLWPKGGGSMPGTLAVSAVEGMAGIGKTALAVHAGHHIADRFPDGVLFCDLRGFTPGAEPTPPDHALDTLLRGLGVPGERIPPDLDARVALYRTLLARRRVLIVLDNAYTEDQVRPLLPGAGGCLVLVTSRRRLAGLDDATHLVLGVMPELDAVTLFRAVAGDRVNGGDQQTVEEIARLCGHLPLAVRIAAARLKTSHAMTPHHLHTELHEELKEKKHLAGLSDGDRSVAAVLAVSYRHLTAEQQHAFRLLGLHPGPDIEPYALAALAMTTVEHAQQLLDDLHAVSLTDQPSYHRYTLHDLVATYATEVAATDPEPERRAALTRLFHHYAHTASVAMDAVYPFEADQRPNPPAPHTPIPDLDVPATAEAWLDADLDNLLTAATHAAMHGWPDHTTHQSATLARHLRTRGRYAGAETLHHHALDAAQVVGNRIGELAALTGLGQVYYAQGRHERAAGCYERALKIAQTTGHRTGEQDALTGLGHIHRTQGQYERAAECFGRALKIGRATGHHGGELNALNGIGWDYLAQGQHEQAASHFVQARELAHATGNHGGEVSQLNGLGTVHLVQGQYDRATTCFRQALDIAREIGDRAELNALNGLGVVHLIQDQYERATDYFGQALEIARATGHRSGELNALTGLDAVRLAQGSPEQAFDYFRRVRDFSRATGNRVGELGGLRGIGNIHLGQGRYDQAADCFEQMLDVASRTGDIDYQLRAHQGMGRVHRAVGDHSRALISHTAALDLATDLDHAIDQARAHDGLAHAYLALGGRALALRHWRIALDIVVTHDITHTDDPQVTADAIRARLAELDRQEGGTA